MQHSIAQALPGAGEEIAATDEKAEGSKHQCQLVEHA